MFDSLLACVIAALALSAYFFFRSKTKGAEQKVEKTEELPDTGKEVQPKGEEENKSRWMEIGGFAMVTYIISTFFSSQTNGQGLEYKIGFWIGNLAIIAVAAGAIIGLVYIVKGKLTFRAVMNTIWIVSGVIYFVLSCAY